MYKCLEWGRKLKNLKENFGLLESRIPLKWEYTIEAFNHWKNKNEKLEINFVVVLQLFNLK